MSELNDEQLIDMELLDVESLLGIIPHECRGFLSIYEQMTPSTPRLEYCIACSDKIIDKYRIWVSEQWFDYDKNQTTIIN